MFVMLNTKYDGLQFMTNHWCNQDNLMVLQPAQATKIIDIFA
jgi:hypothetical protein